MLSVYILVKTRIGEAAAVARSLREVAGVVGADAVIGPYDVVVQARVDDAQSLGRLVAFDVHATPGVTVTLTCLTMEV